jgi:hypothetical protein
MILSEKLFLFLYIVTYKQWTSNLEGDVVLESIPKNEQIKDKAETHTCAT